MRKPLIVANWKMNPGNAKDAFDLAKEIMKGVENFNVDVVLCPPFVFIPQLLPSANVAIGAQDCFWENEGAFTGEISARMLKSLGCSYVILGHSERRKYLGETLEMIHKKVLEALKAQLIPIICIGEDILGEMQKVFKGVQKEDMKHLVLAYEPSWAISTVKNAKPATVRQAKNAILRMRNVVEEKFGSSAAAQAIILYGGSVTSKDIQNFLVRSGIQGALVGASSLSAKEFVELSQNAAETALQVNE